MQALSVMSTTETCSEVTSAVPGTRVTSRSRGAVLSLTAATFALVSFPALSRATTLASLRPSWVRWNVPTKSPVSSCSSEPCLSRDTFTSREASRARTRTGIASSRTAGSPRGASTSTSGGVRSTVSVTAAVPLFPTRSEHTTSSEQGPSSSGRGRAVHAKMSPTVSLSGWRARSVSPTRRTATASRRLSDPRCALTSNVRAFVNVWSAGDWIEMRGGSRMIGTAASALAVFPALSSAIAMIPSVEIVADVTLAGSSCARTGPERGTSAWKGVPAGFPSITS